MKKNRAAHLLAWAAMMVFAVPAAAWAGEAELIRASMIEKIARFVEWPAWEGDRFNLCVSTENALFPSLQAYYAKTALSGKPVALVGFRKGSVPANCQVVFLDEEDIGSLSRILDATRGKPTLLVAEKENSVAGGIHVDFFAGADRLRLEVNRKAIEAGGLKVSYHLLRVARVVE